MIIENNRIVKYTNKLGTESITIELSNELKAGARQGRVKTSDVVKHILKTVEGTLTEKEIIDTALKDISFNGKYPVSGMFDTWEGKLILKF